MQQKQIYLFFLIFGISALFFTCDKGEVEYFLKTDFVFINETDKNISFEIREKTTTKMDLNLEAKSTSKTYTINSDGGFENPTPDNCCQGVLQSFLVGSDQKSIVIKKNDTLCIMVEPAIIDNYKSEIISDRHYKYTFTFTDKNVKNISCSK